MKSAIKWDILDLAKKGHRQNGARSRPLNDKPKTMSKTHTLNEQDNNVY